MSSYTQYKRFLSVLDKDDDIAFWFTTRTGVHIPVKKGQSREEAQRAFFKDKEKTDNSPADKQKESSGSSNKEQLKKQFKESDWDELIASVPLHIRPMVEKQKSKFLDDSKHE